MSEDITTAPPSVPQASVSPTTGPLQGLKNWWNGLGRSSSTTQPPPSASTPPSSTTPLSRMRDKIEEFDEDYRNMGERLLGFFQLLAGYTIPFVMVVAVGNDLGMYFSPYMGDFSAKLSAYAMECAIAALTLAMGRAFEHLSSGNTQWAKVVMTVCGWLLLNTSTAFGLYALASDAPINNTPSGHVMLIVRVVAIASVDLGCSFVLMWRGKSIQKHIEAIHKKAAAISSLADAERSITEADKNAALREQMMQSTLKIQEDLSQKIGQAVSMVMQSILDKMETALQDDGKSKHDTRYGSR